MALSFSKSGFTTITFERGLLGPIEKPKLTAQPSRLSDGNVLYSYDKGVAWQEFSLKFARLSQAQRDDLLTWWDTAAVRQKNTFTYTDEDSVAHTVRWMGDIFDFVKEPATGKWSGTIRLRKEL